MNVNSDGVSAETGKQGKRVRRTPEQARALILEVAGKRLLEMGLEGLNISGVARAAGISHATVIHHFGSTGTMREALLAKMTQELLTDVMEALNHQEPADKLLARLFAKLSQDDHGRLIAWLALDQRSSDIEARAEGTRELFRGIVDAIAAESVDARQARYQVFLVAIAAMGLSLSGDMLEHLTGMSKEEREGFPVWLAEHIQSI